jgi:competence protein ComEC
VTIGFLRIVTIVYTRTIRAFDGDRCANATPADWIDVPASDHLWATERDGDVVLSTTGGGVFVRE